MQIAISDAQPGMILSEDVLLPNGNVLLHRSLALNEDTISLLKKWRITALNVQSPSGQNDELLSETDGISIQSTAGATVADPVQPRIEVIVDDDLMSARLILEPLGNTSTEINFGMLLDKLEQHEIKFGIDESALHSLVEKWHGQKHRYEINKVARGVAAEPGKEGPLHMRSKHLATRSDVDNVRGCLLYWEAIETASRAQRVNPGSVIAEKQPGIPPIPGKNIKSATVLSSEVIKARLTLSNGVKLSDDGLQVLATITGIPFNVDGVIGVVPLDFDGSLEIQTSQNKMSAQLLVHPAGEGGNMPGEAEIRKLLAQSGIIFGVNDRAIKELASGFESRKFPAEPIVIAEGIPAQDGEDGRIEFLFNTETSLKPKLNPDGSVDYKNVDIVNSVGQEQPLARLIAPTEGKPGKDVTGHPVTCEHGVAAKLPIGQNTKTDPKKPDVLLAAVDGIVKYTGTTVEISEGYVISGDVDFSTGNVHYARTVTVGGDIKSGFSVECGGDLQVSGTIEDSHLVIGGNVLCKLGFIGQGKGLIEAKGDINLGFMKNQTAKSRKCINIAKEAINCTIYARQAITVHGNPLSVAGGTLVARDMVCVHTVGNMSGIRTSIEIGLDFSLIEELKKTEAQISEIAVNYRKIIETSTKYERLMAIRKKLTAKEEFLVAKLTTTSSKYEQQIAILEERKKIISTKMYDFKNAHVKIERSAMPGTLIKIGERHYLVKEEIIGPKTVRLINHEIRVL